MKKEANSILPKSGLKPLVAATPSISKGGINLGNLWMKSHETYTEYILPWKGYALEFYWGVISHSGVITI